MKKISPYIGICLIILGVLTLAATRLEQFADSNPMLLAGLLLITGGILMHIRSIKRTMLALTMLAAMTAQGQELQVKINFNTQQIGATDKSVFENLQQTLEQWMNDHQWTELQFQQNERIQCSFTTRRPTSSSAPP